MFQTWTDLLQRYLRVFNAAWSERRTLAPARHDTLERQFLPAILEIVETPAPALARWILWSIVAALAVSLIWSWFGELDEVAVAPGKIIVADKPKLIQAAETAVVRKIHVQDGQTVSAGQVLVELEAAATAAAAETERMRNGLIAARLEAARYAAIEAASSRSAAALRLERPEGAGDPPFLAETRTAHSQLMEYRARQQAMQAEQAKRQAELGAAHELVEKLMQTVPIARRRADDYKSLADRHFVSQHGFLEREQARIEQERELAFQRARVRELEAAVAEAKLREQAYSAEFHRANQNARLDAEKRAVQLEQELRKALAREQQQTLTAPVAGIVQQLAVHSIGGVVTAAQPLMTIVPGDYRAEIEAVLENRDIGFVRPGQNAVIKVETFPYTRYGTLADTVAYVSPDAVTDEQRGLIFQARIRLAQTEARLLNGNLRLTPGMKVSVEIATGRKKVIDYFFDPLRTTISEGLRER